MNSSEGSSSSSSSPAPAYTTTSLQAQALHNSSSSSSKKATFPTSLSDFRLSASPAAAAALQLSAPIPIPSSSTSASGGGGSATGTTSSGGSRDEHPHPLVRRAAGQGGGRLRRSSMLGQEVIPPSFESHHAASSGGARSTWQARHQGRGREEQEEEEDEDMHVEAAMQGDAEEEIGRTSAATTGGGLSGDTDRDGDADDDAPGPMTPGSGVQSHSRAAARSSAAAAAATAIAGGHPQTSSPVLAALHRRRLPNGPGVPTVATVTRTPSSRGSSSPFSARSASEGVDYATRSGSAWPNEAPLAPGLAAMDADGDEDMSGPDEMQSAGSPVASAAVPRTPPRHTMDLTERGASESKSTGSSAPTATSGTTPGGSVTRTGVVRRAVHRRNNLLPKDRSIMRVAATLQDESRPTESELASEFKLSKKLGGEDSPAPIIPRYSRASSPFGAAWSRGSSPAPRGGGGGHGAGGTWNRYNDDEAGSLDGLEFGDGSYPSSDEDAPESAAMPSDGECEMQDAPCAAQSGGTSILQRRASIAGDTPPASMAAPALSTSAPRRGTLWMGFRDMARNRASPGAGAERFLRSRTPGAVSATGSNTSMDIETALPLSLALSSPGPWGRNAKRKLGADERYDPYGSSVYKRRAVSPATLMSSNGTSAGGQVLRSPSLAAASKSSSAAHHHPALTLTPNVLQGATPTSLPTPTPLSIPSPTISFSAMMGAAASSRAGGASYFNPYHARAGGGTPGSASRSSFSRPGSPAPRPSTPTGAPPPGAFANYSAAPSPSLLSTSAGSAAKGAGSGPGYGSGALGLSISGNSAAARGLRFGEEEEGEEMHEGVSNMRLDAA